MLCNPNKYVKTYQEQKEYEFGTRTRAEISRNAATWYKFVSYLGTCHPKSADRLLKYLQYQICCRLALLQRLLFCESWEYENHCYNVDRHGEVRADSEPWWW